jgi:hypothetical protein
MPITRGSREAASYEFASVANLAWGVGRVFGHNGVQIWLVGNVDRVFGHYGVDWPSSMAVARAVAEAQPAVVTEEQPSIDP